MKICPYCSAINEEKNAIKCCVCGRDISAEKEYTKEELDDTNLIDEITTKNKKNQDKKKFKKVLYVSLIPIFIIVLIIALIACEPKGHIDIPINYYEIKTGEKVTIKVNYYNKVTSKNVRMEITSSYYKELNETSFYYQVVDNNFVIEGVKEDHLVLTFTVKDDGEQKKYNNQVTIIILPKESVNE